MKTIDIKLEHLQGYLFTSEERLFLHNSLANICSILDFIQERNKLTEIENKMIIEGLQTGKKLFDLISKNAEEITIRFNSQ